MIFQRFNELQADVINVEVVFQDMENKIRNTLNEIYFGKTKDIVNGLRSAVPLSQMKQRELLKDDLASALRNRGQQS